MTFKKFLFLAIILASIPTAEANIDYMNFDWWKNYNDEILINHMQTIYENNHNLKIAAYKTKQAEENIRLAGANQLPQVGFNGELTRVMHGAQTEFGDLVIPNYAQNNMFLPLSASYQIDIWGQNYLTRQSAKKQKEITVEEERAAYIYITSNFAANYLNFIKIDELIKITKEMIDIQTQIVSMTEKKYNLGLCSINTLLDEKQLLVKMEEDLNKKLENKKVLNNSLTTILGQNTDKEIESSSIKDLKYPTTPETLSATIIQHRPDLIKSEMYAKKAGIDVRIAKRDFLPKFTLFGNLGFNAYRWNSMFNSTTFLSNIGIAPSLDIFTGGYKMARFKINKYEYKKAGEIYEQTMLNSLQEVNDALVQTKTTKANLKKSEEDFSIETQKQALASKEYIIGNSSKLDELKSEINLKIAEQRHITSLINDAISTISLYNATGGIDYTKAENL